MIKILIGLLVALIVMVQVVYLDRLKKYRHVLLAVFTVVLSTGLYFALRDPVASFAQHVQSTDFSSQPKKMVYHATEKDYDNWYVQAMLAYDKNDPNLALVYFGELYQLRPQDQSYYREYADLLLSHDPRNPTLAVIMHALKEQPDRDPGWLLLFARYEQMQGNQEKAEKLYQEALGKLP
ncbi:MAG: tetratricopeptide repeat protein [Gammaproteobacteria bacterium]